MLERKFAESLEKFLLHEPRKILLVNGARQIGKSYLIRYVGNKLFKHFVEINLKADQEGDGIFKTVRSKEDFYLQLGALAGNNLGSKDDTLVFLDEIQSYPHLMTMLKFLNEDGKYRYVASGSQLGVALSQTPSVPIGSIAVQQMYPLDFEEFLWALNNETLMPLIRMNFQKRHEMGQMMHRMAMDYFRQYLIVGGMPQAVAKFVETRDFNKVDRVKRQILTLYRNDIQKYASTYVFKVTQIFDTIPSQLQKHEKKFMLKALTEGARMRDYETAFFWLSDAMIVNMAYNTTEPSIGLGMKTDDTTLKCYMADTGLLISHAFNENTIVSENLYNKLLIDKLEFNGGMIVENIVAQMLRSAGHKLYFFSKYSKDDAQERMELDFLIAKDTITSKHNISPIEVKSTNRYTLTSLKKCIAKYGSYLATPYVLHAADLKVEEGITYLPLYMTGLL